MKDNRLFNYLFKLWYRPIQILACILILFIVAVFNFDETLKGIVAVLLIFSSMVVLASMVILIHSRQWKSFLYNLLAVVLAFVLFASLAPAIVAD